MPIVFWIVGATSAAMVSYLWIDRPLALLIHESISWPRATSILEIASLPNPVVIASAFGAVVFGVISLSRPSFTKKIALGLKGSIAVLTTEVIKSFLKFAFGRPWPESWAGNHPSFIADGAYGFFWFHGGTAYASFPSGHMATVAAFLTATVIYYQTLRLPSIAAGFFVALLLLISNFHFLSDVIGGALLGTLVGIAIIKFAPGPLSRKHSASVLD